MAYTARTCQEQLHGSAYLHEHGGTSVILGQHRLLIHELMAKLPLVQATATEFQCVAGSHTPVILPNGRRISKSETGGNHGVFRRHAAQGGRILHMLPRAMRICRSVASWLSSYCRACLLKPTDRFNLRLCVPLSPVEGTLSPATLCLPKSQLCPVCLAKNAHHV